MGPLTLIKLEMRSEKREEWRESWDDHVQSFFSQYQWTYQCLIPAMTDRKVGRKGIWINHRRTSEPVLKSLFLND